MTAPTRWSCAGPDVLIPGLSVGQRLEVEGTVGRVGERLVIINPLYRVIAGEADARAALDEPGCSEEFSWSQTLGGTRGVIETSAPG